MLNVVSNTLTEFKSQKLFKSNIRTDLDIGFSNTMQYHTLLTYILFFFSSIIVMSCFAVNTLNLYPLEHIWIKLNRCVWPQKPTTLAHISVKPHRRSEVTLNVTKDCVIDDFMLLLMNCMIS